MKIYTKTGDRGDTGLIGGARVTKDHFAIEVCGCLDETNSVIGVACSFELPDLLEADLKKAQQDLFVIGSSVAGCGSDSRTKKVLISEERVLELEQGLDRFVEELPAMNAFILPGGSTSGATLHLARTVCRRAERALVRLMNSDFPKCELTTELIYLNRLSDYLFVAARWANQQEGFAETKWLPDK